MIVSSRQIAIMLYQEPIMALGDTLFGGTYPFRPNKEVQSLFRAI